MNHEDLMTVIAYMYVFYYECVCVCVCVYQYVCGIEWILCCLYVASIVSVSPLLVHSFTLTLSLAPHPFLLSLHFCLCSLYYCYAVFILSLPGRMPHKAA